MVSSVWRGSLVLVLTAMPLACNSLADTCDVNNTCGDAGAADGGADVGSADSGRSDARSDGIPGCPSDGDPKTQPCVIDEAYGVFVSPKGDDGAGQGTRAKPYATLGRAMDAAKTNHVSRVYACGDAGSYTTENVVVGASRDGLTLYGSFGCAGGAWAYDASKLATVAPATPGYALELSALATGGMFEGFAFQTADATGAGASSIAAFVHGSSGVKFQGCTFTAGAGAAGQDQTTPAPFAGAAPGGNSASGLGGGPPVMNPACTSSEGGGGGTGTPGGQDGTDGLPGASNKGVASAQACAGASSGGNGAAGASGTEGAGASSWATFSASGWTPTPGTAGGPGAVGQGGGGGASTDNTGGGGGGGAGGCGGSGGATGTGGGSSIALLVFDSVSDAEMCTITAATAGRGGNGASGQTGQGAGAHGNGAVDGCQGGKGGAGGNGGDGGGGAGGLSAGIVWSGTAPTVNGASTPSAATLSGVTTGTAGAAGTGAAAPQNGKAGVSAAVVQFQ